MLNEKEIELLEYMDYQVLNNGMMGFIANRAYLQSPEFMNILLRRNSEIDQKVISIFQKTINAALDYFQHINHYIPEFKEISEIAELVIDQCGEEYLSIANEFMASYGLEDYHTKFVKTFT